MSETLEKEAIREVTFTAFPDGDDISVHLNQERPDFPIGILNEVQKTVDETVAEGQYNTDEIDPVAGKVTYIPNDEVVNISVGNLVIIERSHLDTLASWVDVDLMSMDTEDEEAAEQAVEAAWEVLEG